jgi:hypothetical protein
MRDQHGQKASRCDYAQSGDQLPPGKASTVPIRAVIPIAFHSVRSDFGWLCVDSRAWDDNLAAGECATP